MKVLGLFAWCTTSFLLAGVSLEGMSSRRAKPIESRAPARTRNDIDREFRGCAKTAQTWLEDLLYEKFRACQGKESWQLFHVSLDALERVVREACEVYARDAVSGGRMTDLRRTEPYHHGCYFAALFSLMRQTFLLEVIAMTVGKEEQLSEAAFERGRLRLKALEGAYAISFTLKELQRVGLFYLIEQWQGKDWVKMRADLERSVLELVAQLRRLLPLTMHGGSAKPKEKMEEGLLRLLAQLELWLMSDTYVEKTMHGFTFVRLDETAGLDRCPVLRTQMQPFIQAYKRGEPSDQDGEKTALLLERLAEGGFEFLLAWTAPYVVDFHTADELRAAFADLALDEGLTREELLRQISEREEARVLGKVAAQCQ